MQNPLPGGREWSTILQTIRTPSILLGLMAFLVVVGGSFLMVVAPVDANQKMIIAGGVFILLIAILGIILVLSLFRPEALTFSETAHLRRRELELGAKGLPRRRAEEFEAIPIDLPPPALPEPEDDVEEESAP